MGSIMLVHGTGVRLKSYQESFSQAVLVSTQVGIKEPIHACAWGDCAGATKAWRSLPELGNQSAAEVEDLEKWSWLFESPYFELLHYATGIDGLMEVASTGFRHDGHDLLQRLQEYEPSLELKLLLERGALSESWSRVWRIIMMNPLVAEVLEHHDDDLADIAKSLARSVVAQLHNDAIANGLVGPGMQLRVDLVNRLLVDWGQYVLGGSLVSRLASQAITYCVRRNRAQLNDSISLIIGDILWYQSRGEQLQKHILDKLASLSSPITVVAHSLGGIAIVDLLVEHAPPSIKYLVTVGSQAPFLNELGALKSLKAGVPLPSNFPKWLNIYDQNDFLSFRASPIWRGVTGVPPFNTPVKGVGSH